MQIIIAIFSYFYFGIGVGAGMLAHYLIQHGYYWWLNVLVILALLPAVLLVRWITHSSNRRDF